MALTGEGRGRRIAQLVQMIMQIHIKNLRLRTIVGVEQRERTRPQDVIVNVWVDFESTRALTSDEIADALDYEALTRRVTEEVENSSFHLLETLTARILDLVMEHPMALGVSVEVEKPQALELADSVSVRCSKQRKA